MSTARALPRRRNGAPAPDTPTGGVGPGGAHQERLSVLGYMASSVAHDLSNPLATIGACAESLLTFLTHDPNTLHGPADAVPPQGELREDLELILQETRRAGAIVHGLLAFARDEEPRRTTVSLTSVIKQVTRLARHHLSHHDIQVEIDEACREDTTPSWAWVTGDASRLQQVVMNLIINSQQAISHTGSGGTIWIRIERRVPNHAAIVIEDDGPGVPPDLHEAIFRPYYTTKPDGVGTGLGLAIAANIVADHHGEISVRDRRYGGAEFAVILPTTAERVPPTPECRCPAPSAPSRTIPHLGRRVLLIDDEPGILRSVGRFLERLACDVTTAGTGREALSLLADQTFDVILCDIRMPDLNGDELFEEIRTRHPDALDRLAFMSGDLMCPETREFLDSCGRPSIQKPYELEDLVQLIVTCSPPASAQAV